MKRFNHRIGWILLILGFALVRNLPAKDEWHHLQDSNGKSVKAQIISYDSTDDTVEIQRADDKRFKVNLSIFSEETQNEIRAWGYGYEFYETLQISVDTRQLDAPDIDFGKKYTAFEIDHIGYQIKLENPSETTFSNIEIIYCLYYRQLERYTGGRRLIEDGVTCGQFKVDSVEPGSNHDLTTDTILLYYDRSGDKDIMQQTELFGRERYRLEDARGDVVGLRVRIIAMSPSGEKLMREHCTPPSLRKYTQWTTTSRFTPLNLEQEKRKQLQKGILINVLPSSY